MNIACLRIFLGSICKIGTTSGHVNPAFRGNTRVTCLSFWAVPGPGVSSTGASSGGPGRNQTLLQSLKPGGPRPPLCAAMAGGKRAGGGAGLAAQNAALMEQLAALTKLVDDLRKELATLKKKDVDPKPAAGNGNCDEGLSKGVAPRPAGRGGFEATLPKQKDTTPARNSWVTVGAKKENKQKDGTKAPALKLRPGDWPVPPVEVRDLRGGGEGVCLATQIEGEQLYRDLKDAGGKIALITIKPIEAAGDKSRKIDLKALNAEGRLVVLERHLTPVGEKIKATYEKTATVNEATLELSNTTKKIVIKAVKEYCPPALYNRLRLRPQEALNTWLEEQGCRRKVLYGFKPTVKAVGDSEWIEAIMVIKEKDVVTFHKLSGKDGLFVNLYRTGEQGEDAWRIVRFEPGTTLAAAREKRRLHEEAAHGLVFGRWGLGVRFPKDDFQNRAKNIFRTEAAKKETERLGQKFYELTKEPPWVDFEEAKDQLEKKWKWDVAYRLKDPVRNLDCSGKQCAACCFEKSYEPYHLVLGGNGLFI